MVMIAAAVVVARLPRRPPRHHHHNRPLYRPVAAGAGAAAVTSPPASGIVHGPLPPILSSPYEEAMHSNFSCGFGGCPCSTAAASPAVDPSAAATTQEIRVCMSCRSGHFSVGL